MKALKKTFKRIYLEVLGSIAFYPVIIGAGFLISSMLLLSYENLKFAEYLKENAPFLYVRNLETARTILSTLVGSILSLMVFSFSMVMVVLNQASSNFSPRLLPGLISDNKHQMILGVYVGTLIHCVLVLIALGSYDKSQNSIGFSTMIAAVLGIICVVLFISFIHNISNSIRIDNIIQRIFNDSKAILDKALNRNKYELNESTTEWISIKSNKTGYYRGFNKELLDDYFNENPNTIYIIPYRHQYVWEGDTILKINNNIPKDKLELVMVAIEIFENRFDEESFLNGLIKLMEVAVKAMSPGINDPGTAINALYKLSDLLNKSLKLPLYTKTTVEHSGFTIIHTNIGAKELMQLLIQPIRNYSKKDSTVSKVLINTLQHLIKDKEISSDKRGEIKNEFSALISDIKKHITNEKDKNYLLELVSKTNE